MRLACLVAASSLFTFAAMAQADCSWGVGWPNDKRIWTVPWGDAPRSDFATRTECERAIENMLGEAIRGQALLIELPACICVPGYDDFAQEGIWHARPSSASTKSSSGDSQRDTAVRTRELHARWTG